MTERDADTIRGEWDWQTWLGVTPLREQGRFTMYRALDGRKLVMDFEEVERTIGAGDEPRRRKGPRVISFTKVSKRVVLWEEIY